MSGGASQRNYFTWTVSDGFSCLKRDGGDTDVLFLRVWADVVHGAVEFVVGDPPKEYLWLKTVQIPTRRKRQQHLKNKIVK